MTHYRIQKIIMHDPHNPYEPNDDEHVLTMHVDPKTPEGMLISSMLFGMHDDGVAVAPEVLRKLHKSPSKYVNRWDTETKKTTRNVRFGLGFSYSVWDPYKGTPSEAFLRNEKALRAEIYPRYVEEAAQAWIAINRDDPDKMLETYLNIRARLLVVAEAAGVESEAVAMDDLNAAVNRIRDAQKAA